MEEPQYCYDCDYHVEMERIGETRVATVITEDAMAKALYQCPNCKSVRIVFIER